MSEREKKIAEELIDNVNKLDRDGLLYVAGAARSLVDMQQLTEETNPRGEKETI